MIDLRAALTSLMIEKEHLDSNYDNLLTTYNNYKAKVA